MLSGPSKFEPVLQHIVHTEPAAFRDEELLNLQADEDFASNVEWRLHGMGYTAGAVTQGEDVFTSEKVHILRFGSGNTEDFRETLLEGPQFHPCREALESAGYACCHSSTALLFVHPNQFPDVERALDDHELHPFHVVITESLEYLLAEILEKMPCRQRPREKSGTRLELGLPIPPQGLASGSKASGPDGVAIDLILVVRRTFLCVAPQLKEANTVVQSTTEACTHAGELSESPNAYRKGLNPRRFA